MIHFTGKLIEAATVLADERILGLLADTDCVAAEVSYHNSCRLSYIYKSEKQPRADSQPHNDDECWDRFLKNVIEREILAEGKNYRLTDLLKMYHKICPNDAMEHSNTWMRSRLLRFYTDGELVFHKSQTPQISDLVTRKYVQLNEIIDDTHIISARVSASSENDSSAYDPFNLNASTNSSTSDPFGLDTSTSCRELVFEQSTRLEMQHTAMFLKKEIMSITNQISHPLSAESVTPDAALGFVPPSLFNFIAITTGAVDISPYGMNTYATVKSPEKILAVCQDIISLTKKKDTPKAMALGITVRHASGSKYLIDLLSGLGHVPSYDKILRAETALAYKQLANQKGNHLPEGFQRGVFTNLVYDNIDFLEETLSGAGTSHYTNGIMFQLKQNSSSVTVTVPAAQGDVPKSKKTFTPTKHNIDPFFLFKKVGPSTPNIDLTGDKTMYEISKHTDQAYVVSKTSSDPNTAPTSYGWTASNKLANKPLPESVIHYLPIIEASPTEYATVKHVLDSAMATADNLRCDTVVVVFDQAIYAKAQQIRWDDSVLQDKLVIRLGEFHTLMTYLAAIGKRFASSGLEDILVESGVIANGSLKGVLNGHMYNRSIRAHKLLFEALARLQVADFMSSSDVSMRTRIDGITPLIKRSDKADLDDIVKQFTTHITTRCKENPTYCFWNSYLEMVFVALAFIRASRTSDFQLHVSSLRRMLPWFFAYDRTNYARYGTAYWLEMSSLPHTHPWIHDQILAARGCWTYQRQAETGFNGMAGDQAIETTVNKESKTSGGITGITVNRGALQRWLLSKPAKAAISAECEKMAGLRKNHTDHKELLNSRMVKDETDIASMMEAVSSRIDPFASEQTELIGLTSGIVADSVLKTQLLEAELKGEQMLKDFVSNRIEKNETDFFAPLKNAKLQTFAAAPKRRPAKATELAHVKSDRSLFVKLLLVAKERGVNMRDVLCYSLTPVPGCLSNVDGSSISKTNKSALVNILEQGIPETAVTSKPSSSAVLIDTMALIQSLPQTKLGDTFGQLVGVIFLRAVQIGAQFNAVRIDLVGDRYDVLSIKNVERDRRNQTSQEVKIYNADQKLPVQWKKYLSSGKNKQALQQFIAETIPQQTLSKKMNVIIGLTKSARQVFFDPNQSATITDLPELDSDHEEADTRLILHALHCTSHSNIVIWSPDTDVAAIGISHAAGISANLLMSIGSGKNRRLINLSTISSHLESFAAQLSTFHALTGCDTTSCFYGKGKKSAMSVVRQNPVFMQSLSKLGEEFVLNEIPPGIEEFVCKMYGLENKSVNDARYELFKTGSSEKSLPPNKDALLLHLKRVNYQAKIWKSATDAIINPPSPDGHGWCVEGENMSITWLTESHAPTNILKTQKCACKTGCSGGKCSCLKANLKCTALCSCTGCSNKTVELEEASPSDLDDDSDEEDL